MQFKFVLKNKIRYLPKSSGVYFLATGKNILYIGKASNLKERVKNHFHPVKYREAIIFPKEKLFNRVKQIGYIKTDSEIEALILEANLIKKYQPKYNVIWKDDKNYFYVGITKEDFPRIFITHQPELKISYVGPFVDGIALRQVLKILRKVFPYRSCNKIPKRPCLWYQIDRCPAPCILRSNLGKQLPNANRRIKSTLKKNTRNVLKILQGKKNRVLKDLDKEMRATAASADFEKAAKVRDQIKALERILAHYKISESSPADSTDSWDKTRKELKNFLNLKKEISKIEAYDISNIQGKFATGSMVTFINGRPNKNFYRRFKIKYANNARSAEASRNANAHMRIEKPNDIAMLKEVLSRRFKHLEWPYPNLMLIDGGKAQLNATINSLNQHKSARSALISVLALAKKENKLYLENRKEPIRLNSLPNSLKFLILHLRDEAHRFAISYHKKLRQRSLLQK